MVKQANAGSALSRRLKVDASASPENYVSYNINSNFVVGSSSGAGTPSLGWNDYTLNNGAHIGLGTGTNLRIGKHVFFTYLRLKLFFQVGSGGRVRLIVAKNPLASQVANLTSNGAITAFAESELLEAPMSGTNPNVSDRFVTPSTDYQVISDKTIGWDTMFAAMPSATATMVSVDITVPLMLQRMYNSSNLVDRGDFVIYMCTNLYGPNNVAPLTTYLGGQMRLEFINQFNWETIPRAIKGTINAADDILSHANKSPVVRALMAALRLL